LKIKNILLKIPIVRELIRTLEKNDFQKKWKSENTHNYTSVGNNVFPLQNVKVGSYTYGVLNVYSLYIQPSEKLDIGNYVSIAPNVQFLLGANHQTDTITTYPLFSRFVEYDKIDALSKGEIIIEDEVWLGTNSIIVSGVRIGKGAIIASGSIVTKDVPPYSIYGGNPAKLIKMRFSEDIIKEFLGFSLMDIPTEKIIENIDLFYRKINTLEDIRKLKYEMNSLKSH
jgi:acetyltransferase-like isoleucine patch superfamily enzyme